MLEQLKIKIKTVASEATYIRHEERKQNHIRHFERQAQSFRHQKDKPRPEPRVYPEPKENSQEIYDEAEFKFFNLQRYRTQQLRKEARLSHLAYAFLRGTPYSQAEQKTHSIIDMFEDQITPSDVQFRERRIFDKVKSMAKRFAADMNIKEQVFLQKWAEWVDDAKDHIKKQHPEVAKEGTAA